jgi:hypothetical protein
MKAFRGAAPRIALLAVLILLKVWHSSDRQKDAIPSPTTRAHESVAKETAKSLTPLPGLRPSESKSRKFLDLSAQFLAELPRLRPAGNPGAPEDHHKALMLASLGFGKIADELKQNPGLASEGMAFYRQCAADETVLSAARALCLRNLRYWSSRAGESVPEAEYPQPIRKLADALPKERP